MANPFLIYWIASIGIGLALAAVAWTLLTIGTVPRVEDVEKGRFETARRTSLRLRSSSYRLLEPWIDEIAGRMHGRKPELEEQVRQNLVASAEPAPWEPVEYLAATRCEAILAGILGFLFGWYLSSLSMGLFTGAGAFFLYERLKLRSLARRASRRKERIKRRLSASMDLMALMMEVGGGFQEAMTTVAREEHGHPLGDEFDRVIKDIEGGRPRKQALQSLADRLTDDDAAELIFAVVKGEELGTPLATILRNQADQMRQKRSQWAEKASEEAQVTLVFPAMIIMVACLIIVATPFVLSSLFVYRAGG